MTILDLIRAEVPHPDLKRLVDDPSTTLHELQIDGPARAHLGMEIEDHFNVYLTDEAIQAWDTVADVLAVVKEEV